MASIIPQAAAIPRHQEKEETETNKRKSNKRTKSTTVSYLFPKVIAMLKGLKTQEQNNTRQDLK